MNLDNRELALIIWLMLFIVFFHLKLKSREALYGIWHALTQRKMLYLLAALASYVVACVWLLSAFGWWKLSNLKATLVWTISFIFITIFNFNKIESEKSYFRTVLIEAVGLGAFLSFISSSHTFGLISELVITFLLIVLSLATAISMNDVKLKPAHNLVTTVLATISLLILANSIYHIITEFREFATYHTAREFLLPIALTALSIPFLYGLYIYSAYERIFASLKFSIKDSAVRKKSKRKLITQFGLDIAGLEKWHRHIGVFEQTCDADIDSSIAEIKCARNRERHPPINPPKTGWLPNEAINFLSSVNLKTLDYHRSYAGWWAFSSHLKLDKELISNNIAYYIEGDELAVLKLKLILNINSPQVASVAEDVFFQIVDVLIHEAIPDEFEPNEKPSFSIGTPPIRIGNYELTLERENWTGGIKGGYELRFTIEETHTDSESASPESLALSI
ncbi:TPA: hypothetical protein OUC02_005034 [Escherichia coli]|nr:hypothetical protein [Escherichia coli]